MIVEQLSGIHWWYKTASHAAELTAGFYNPCNCDGYAPIASMLKKHETAMNFTCVELRTVNQNEDFPEALADPEGLVWQVTAKASYIIYSKNFSFVVLLWLSHGWLRYLIICALIFYFIFCFPNHIQGPVNQEFIFLDDAYCFFFFLFEVEPRFCHGNDSNVDHNNS